MRKILPILLTSTALGGLLLTTNCACFKDDKPTPPKPSIPEGKVLAYYANHASVTRDITLANSFKNQHVAMFLASNEYKIEGTTVRIYGTVPNAPAILIFHCIHPIPRDEEGNQVDLEIIGFLEPPIRDKVWRSITCDYYVNVTACVVNRR